MFPIMYYNRYAMMQKKFENQTKKYSRTLNGRLYCKPSTIKTTVRVELTIILDRKFQTFKKKIYW